MKSRLRNLIPLGILLLVASILHLVGGSSSRNEEGGIRGGGLSYSAEDRKKWADLEIVVTLIESGKEDQALVLLLERHRELQQAVVDAAMRRMTGAISSVGDAIASRPTIDDKLRFIKNTAVTRQAVTEELDKLRYSNFLFNQARVRLASRVAAPVEIRSGSFVITVDPLPRSGGG